MATITIENQKYDFPSLYKGETFKSRDIRFTKKDGSAPDIELVEIHLKFFDELGNEILSLDQDDGITIVDPINWEVIILGFDIPFNKGRYSYQIYTINDSSETEYVQYGFIDIKI
jgi:hypothetical protein